MEDQGLYAIISTVVLSLLKLVAYLKKKKSEKVPEDENV